MTAPTSATGPRPASAAAMILVAMALMGLVDNYVVVIAETAGLWQFQVLRSAMALAALAIVARAAGWRLRPRRWRAVAARSAVLSVALILYFGALAALPIAEAVAGLFTGPLWVTLLAATVFGHRVPPLRAVAALVGFAGVLAVLRPEAGGIGWLTLLPLVSGLFYGLAQIATREWCAGEGALTLLAGFFVAMGVWGIVGLVGVAALSPADPGGTAAWALRGWAPMSGAAWLWTVAQAGFSLVAVGLIIRAYQSAEASFVAVYEYALLPFAVLWGWWLMGHAVDAWTLAGIAAIVASGALSALSNRAPGAAPIPAPVPPAGRWPARWRGRR